MYDVKAHQLLPGDKVLLGQARKQITVKRADLLRDWNGSLIARVWYVANYGLTYKEVPANETVRVA